MKSNQTFTAVLPVPFENQGERVLRLQQHVVALQTDQGNILGGTNAVDINTARIEYFTRDRGVTIQQPPTVQFTDDSFIHSINDRFLERAVSINLGDAPHDTVTGVVAQVAEANSVEELGFIFYNATQNGVTVDLANFHAGLHIINSRLANNPDPLLANFTQLIEQGRLRRRIAPLIIEYITGSDMNSFSVSLFSLFLLFGVGGLDQVIQTMTSYPGPATAVLLRFFRWVLTRLLNFNFWLCSFPEIIAHITAALRSALNFLRPSINRIPTFPFYWMLRRIIDFGFVGPRNNIWDSIQRGITAVTRASGHLMTFVSTLTVLFGGVRTLYGLMARYPALFTDLIRLLRREPRTVGRLAKDALKQFFEGLFRS
jgi:hypothetical protein